MHGKIGENIITPVLGGIHHDKPLNLAVMTSPIHGDIPYQMVKPPSNPPRCSRRLDRGRASRSSHAPPSATGIIPARYNGVAMRTAIPRLEPSWTLRHQEGLWHGLNPWQTLYIVPATPWVDSISTLAIVILPSLLYFRLWRIILPTIRWFKSSFLLAKSISENSVRWSMKNCLVKRLVVWCELIGYHNNPQQIRQCHMYTVSPLL